MSSIIPEYNYDIFISYRQKDNKGDRWVSEFVETLKTELESTFKEDISVYFDINPHDGLLETHDVDASLKEKLKCLVFIPIISRTYCDPKSYAWNNEFKPFVEQASKDRFGLKVRLPNGNVASRIMPVRIHDLEAEDVKLFEGVTGLVMRTLDFVFKTSSGVNRPLRSKEDHPAENINRIYYQDQINKVALAIKEIIQGMKTGSVSEQGGNVEMKEPSEETVKDRKVGVEKKLLMPSAKKLLVGIIISILLVIAALLIYPKTLKQKTIDDMRSSGERISVAVMPFQNMTNDTSWNIWQDGIQDILITCLSNSPEELKVRQTELIDNLIKDKGITSYASITPSVASTISQKLDANIFIYGSIKQAGAIMRVSAQVIDSRTGEIIKSFEIDGPLREDAVFLITDSLKQMVKNYLLISKMEKELPVGYRYFQSTNSSEAFRYYLYGQKAFYNKDFLTAIKLFSKATAIDSSFISAYFSLGVSYANLGILEEATKLLLKFYPLRDQLPVRLKVKLESYYASIFETPFEEIRYLKQLQEFDDQDPVNYYNLGEIYTRINQFDKAIPEFEKALAIYKKWGSKPLWAPNYSLLGYSLHKTGQYKKEEKLYKKAEQDFPYDIDLIYRQVVLSLTEGNIEAMKGYIEKLRTVLKENSYSEAEIVSNIAKIYSEAGFRDQAEEHFKKALSLDPENPSILNHLSKFLIDSDRNINEGLDIIERALSVKPDNHIFLYTKGSGLYKQGKYQEAYDILQKSWELRRIRDGYDHDAFLLLQDAKKAVAGIK